MKTQITQYAKTRYKKGILSHLAKLIKFSQKCAYILIRLQGDKKITCVI